MIATAYQIRIECDKKRVSDSIMETETKQINIYYER